MPPRRNTKETLILSLMRLVAQYGMEAATISAVAHEAGVTQGAVYRHYRSKEELLWCAYKQTIESMAHEKEALVRLDIPIQQKICRWIELTFLYFDRDPDAFTYVLLTPHPNLHHRDNSGITTRQGRLFMQLFSTAVEAQLMRNITPEVALTHFTGLMLNVPRLINEGLLAGPAVPYLDEVADAVWRVLSLPRHRKG